MSFRHRVFRSKERTAELDRMAAEERASSLSPRARNQYAWFSQNLADQRGWFYDCRDQAGSEVAATHIISKVTTQPPAPDAILVGIVTEVLGKKTSTTNADVINNNIDIVNAASGGAPQSRSSLRYRTPGQLLPRGTYPSGTQIEIWEDGAVVLTYTSGTHSEVTAATFTFKPTCRYTVRVTPPSVDKQDVDRAVRAATDAVRRQLGSDLNRVARDVASVDRKVTTEAATARQRLSATDQRLAALAKADMEIQKKLHTNTPVQTPAVVATQPPRPTPSARTKRTFTDMHGNMNLPWEGYKRSIQNYVRGLRSKPNAYIKVYFVRELAPAVRRRAERRGWSANNRIVMDSTGTLVCTTSEWRDATTADATDHPLFRKPAPRW